MTLRSILLQAPVALLGVLAISAPAWAQDAAPEPVEAVSPLPAPPTPESHAPLADQCANAVELVPGRTLPVGLADARGIVLCRGTVLPSSELAYFLDRDTWVEQAAPRLDLLQLQIERSKMIEDWQRKRADRLQLALDKPPPFFKRPGVQHALGAVEALAFTVVVGAIWVNLPDLKSP